MEVATSLVTELRLLVTHRTDLVGDRVRMVNRLRDVLSGYFPGRGACSRSGPRHHIAEAGASLPADCQRALTGEAAG